ncbi:glycosyltransferase [Falsihalocynthiibacter sp. S25ZX9]|uniref:glycosyltransferase n=2 Tax=unclassified Falsihalocynthiibacter TaxID=2854191 RepID=UPI00350FBED1
MPSFAGGGAERVMVMLSNALAQRNYQVDIVVCQASGPFHSDVAPTVRVVDLKSKRAVLALPRLTTYLRTHRPDVFLSVLTHTNVVAILAATMARTGVRLVVGERNSLASWAIESRGIKRRIRNFLVRALYPKADAIFGNSYRMSEEISTYLSLDPRKVRTIYNPLSIEMIARKAEPLPTHPWIANKSCPVVIGAGRLTEQKDFGTLISAFAEFRKHQPARLIIFGDGPDRDVLQEKCRQLGVSDNVDFPGFSSELHSALKRADIFVLSSRWEGLPNILLEAIACGVSVVSTDCPTGPAEILGDGQWGRLCPVGDVACLANAMTAALVDPITVLPEEALAAFDPEMVLEAYLEVLFGENGGVVLAEREEPVT